MEEKQGTPSSKFHLETRLVGESIDLRRVSEECKEWDFLNRGSDPLIAKVTDGQFVAMTKFGTVGFWNIEGDTEAGRILERISSSVQSRQEKYDFSDTLDVLLGTEKDVISFDEARLTAKEMTLELLEIFSYVPAQSVALDRYEQEIGKLLEEFRPIIENLKRYGKPGISEKKLLQMIGRVLSVEENVVGTISLLDKPDKLWEKKKLEGYYDELSGEYFDMSDRFEALNKKTALLAKYHDTFLTIISSKKSYRLEKFMVWLDFLIVILIVLELLPALPYITKLLHR